MSYKQPSLLAYSTLRSSSTNGCQGLLASFCTVDPMNTTEILLGGCSWLTVLPGGMRLLWTPSCTFSLILPWDQQATLHERTINRVPASLQGQRDCEWWLSFTGPKRNEGRRLGLCLGPSLCSHLDPIALPLAQAWGEPGL